MKLHNSYFIAISFTIRILFVGSAATVLGQSLDTTYANTQCGISIQHPSNWKSGEDNDEPPGVTNFIVEVQPDTPNGFKNVVSIELDDISGLSDKSFAGVKDFEEKATIQGGLSRIITSEGTQIAGYPAQNTLC